MKILSPKQREALSLIADGRFFPAFVKEDDGWHARWRAFGVDNPWIDSFVRASVKTALTEDAEDQRHETLHDAWMMALRSTTGLVRWDDAECGAFAASLSEWHGEDDTEVRRALVFDFKSEKDSFSLGCEIPRGRAAMKALGQSTYVWGKLRELKRKGGRLEVALVSHEAEDFLRRGAKELRDAGYTVKGDDSLKVEVSAAAEIESESAPPRLSIRVAGEVVSAEEIRFLLEQNSTLVYFRDRWIEIDRGILKEALRALEKQGSGKARIMTFALGLGHLGALEIAEIRLKGEIRSRIDELRAAANGDFASPLPLRDYQRRGAAWMKYLTDHGYGALLADDMGLGKTIQTIAWMLAERPAEKGHPFLVLAPLTLISNWRHEIERFAPSLSVYVHQGETRHLGSGFKYECARADVVLSSYNLVVKDNLEFAETEWSALILDEAQTIKNPDTQSARAIRALGVQKRIALTGTPIENSVADLWSIEEFLNPGLLGDRDEFEERFVDPLSFDPNHPAGQRLRRALEPLVLRRLKSEPGIAGELGGKREIKEYCVLSASDRADYETALSNYRLSERRQGDVFALLTRLKLICDGEGKFARLVELLEGIFANGESALVFTQYAKVGEWLRKELSAKFGMDMPFLHGALSAAERERQIRRFRASRRPSAFVLSLKAGGFGLNLTKATHVIHFDRWWNPAVESQATDRAHRIGQERDVFVHAFIAEGTLEERIDRILEKKLSLEGLLRDGEEFLRIVELDK